MQRDLLSTAGNKRARRRADLLVKLVVGLTFLLPLAHPKTLAAQQSLSLREAIRMGLAQAPEAQASADRVELERAQVPQARMRPNPRLFLSSEDLHPWNKDFSFENNTEDYGYLGYTVELDGKRGKRITYAEGNVSRGEAQHAYELAQIAAGIADAYWTAAATREAVVEWQQQVVDFDRIVRYESDRVKAGANAGVDLLRTEIERDRIALAAAQASRDAEAASIELGRRTASAIAGTAQLSDALEQERPVPELPLSFAVEQRSDIVAARAAVADARNDVRLQHANAVPNLDFLGGYKRNSGVDTAYGGLQIDLPFYNRNQGGIAAAHANSQLAEDELAYTRLSASSEIATAAGAFHRETALVRTVLPGMNSRAAQHASIINDAYRSGGTDLLRFLDAERLLIDTRLLAIQTWADYQRSAVSLRLAYGEQP